MKCTICGTAIVLVPSAAERAARYGGKAEDYTKLLSTHGSCAVKKRSDESVELMRSINANTPRPFIVKRGVKP